MSTKPQRRRKISKTNTPPPAKKGRKLSKQSTKFATWLDAYLTEHKSSIEAIAEKVGISASSLYQIRRGDQGVSLATAQKLITFSDGELVVGDFVG